jgi:hypothetical protein
VTVTMCSSGAVVLKAGLNAKILTDANYTTLINQAESFINTATRINFTDTYAGLNADVKLILEDAASSYAAIGVINYDMSGFYSRTEAQTMLDVNWAKFRECINLLIDKKHTDFIEGA